MGKMFCKTCGGLLTMENTPFGRRMSCLQGHTQPLTKDTVTLTVKNPLMGKKILVGEEKNILAVYDHLCQKCGYNKAELLEISSFYTDEDNIYRMKCGRCGFVEQLEGKVK